MTDQFAVAGGPDPRSSRPGASSQISLDLAVAMSTLLEGLLAEADLSELWAIRNRVAERLSCQEAEQFDALFGRILKAYGRHLGLETQVSRLHHFNQSLASLLATGHGTEVFGALTEGVRRLTGADTAFFALRDARHDDVRMGHTHGTVSPDMMRLRLDLGVGIGGGVSATGQVFSTEDYLHDSRLEHDEFVDSVVSREGLQRMVGVPVTNGSQVLGVLFASNRSARPIAAEALSLMAQLADSAAPVIERSLHTGPEHSPRSSVVQLAPDRPVDAAAKDPALDTVLNNKLLHPEFSAHAIRLNSTLSEEHVLLVVRSSGSAGDAPPRNLLTWWAGRTRHWCTVGADVVALVEAEEAERLAAACDRAHPGRLLATSEPITDVRSLADAYRALSGKLAAALANGGTGRAPEDRNVYSLLFGGPRELRDFVTGHLGALWTYDLERGSELGMTLRTYLHAGLQHRATAERLHIHANTLYRRFELIERLLGSNWRSELDLLELQLAFRVAHLVPEMAPWAESWSS